METVLQDDRNNLHSDGEYIMENIELGDVIAQRKLEATRADGTKSELIVKIGTPKMFPDSSDFFAPYQICGLGDEEVWYAGGVDAVQALQLSMGMIGAELSALRSRRNVDIRWEGDTTGRLGFND